MKRVCTNTGDFIKIKSKSAYMLDYESECYEFC